MGAFSVRAIYQNMLIFCAKTLHTCVEYFVVNNGISNIRVHCVEPGLYRIKVGCNLFWDILYIELASTSISGNKTF